MVGQGPIRCALCLQVARKLSSIQWAGYNKVDLHAHNVPAQGRLGALWATLPLLASWFPTSFGLCVCGLPMSQELSAWLAAAAAAGWDQPGLEGSTLAPDVAITPHIPLMSYIHLHNQELDDGLLAQLSECVGFMWRLYVAGKQGGHTHTRARAHTHTQTHTHTLVRIVAFVKTTRHAFAILFSNVCCLALHLGCAFVLFQVSPLPSHRRRARPL